MSTESTISLDDEEYELLVWYLNEWRGPERLAAARRRLIKKVERA